MDYLHTFTAMHDSTSGGTAVSTSCSLIFVFAGIAVPSPSGLPLQSTISWSVDGIHCLRRLSGRGMKKSFAEYPGLLVVVSS